MPVQVSIGGPVLALRGALDEANARLRSTSGEAAQLAARLRRYERTEQVLQDSLRAAQEELGVSEHKAGSLHDLVEGLRKQALEHQATLTSEKEARLAAEQELERERGELKAAKQKMQSMQQQLSQLVAKLDAEVAQNASRQRQVRCTAALQP